MDMPGNEPITEPPKETEESVNYHSPNISLVGSFVCAPVWDPQINGPILSYCNANVQNEATSSSPSRAGANWAYRQNLCVPTFPSSVVPPRLPNFLEDSSFIDRAARFSCFGGGNLSQMINPFSNLGHLNANTRSSLIQRPNEVLAKNEMKIENFRRSHDEVLNGVDLLGTETDKAEYSGREEGQEEFPGKGIGVGLKKRKRAELKIVNDESKEAVQPANKTEDNTNENGGNDDGKDQDPPKEDYIHVRARRGQATNSHSLAERIRREKISERMKFLQDLVPGCSKVTGKAVMLDEIINYVQSLQRQVEFLSMKLAMVNPSLDFDIEGVLSKDIIQTRAGLSSSLAFPPDMMVPFSSIRQPQNQVIHQTALHRPIDFQSNVVSGGSREPTSHHLQEPGVWDDDELHNVVQNGFNLTALQHTSDLSGHAKAEP